jgi:hypothetical protein
VLEALRDLDSSDPDWAAVLSSIDQRLASDASAGETTAVVAFIEKRRVVGGSLDHRCAGGNGSRRDRRPHAGFLSETEVRQAADLVGASIEQEDLEPKP